MGKKKFKNEICLYQKRLNCKRRVKLIQKMNESFETCKNVLNLTQILQLHYFESRMHDLGDIITMLEKSGGNSE